MNLEENVPSFRSSFCLGFTILWFEEETWGGVYTTSDGLSFTRLLGAWWGGISPGVVGTLTCTGNWTKQGQVWPGMGYLCLLGNLGPESQPSTYNIFVLFLSVAQEPEGPFS